jgi:hypothetical protein
MESSETHIETAFGPIDAIEDCYSRGWTDGLPVVPPTPERVAALLDYVGLNPKETLGEVPVRSRSLKAEQAAANAVMAGCLPEYFPIVLGAMRALFEHDPNCIHELSSVTNSTGVLILVNGPIRNTIGLNCTDNLLSPGNRANSTIARAIRLILINVFEQRPGLLDRGCMGSPVKYNACFGEDEENSPWEPFHVSRGFSPDDSTVTVASIQDPGMVSNRYGAGNGEGVMNAVADAMASHGLATYFTRGVQWFWVVGHWHSEYLSRFHWDREAMQRYIQKEAWRSRADLKRLGAIRGDVIPEDEDDRVFAAYNPEDIHIIKAGGNSGIYSEVIMNYYGVFAKTVKI